MTDRRRDWILASLAVQLSFTFSRVARGRFLRAFAYCVICVMGARTRVPFAWEVHTSPTAIDRSCRSRWLRRSRWVRCASKMLQEGDETSYEIASDPWVPGRVFPVGMSCHVTSRSVASCEVDQEFIPLPGIKFVTLLIPRAQLLKIATRSFKEQRTVLS